MSIHHDKGIEKASFSMDSEFRSIVFVKGAQKNEMAMREYIA